MKTNSTHLYFYSGPDIYSNWHPAVYRDPALGNAPFANTEQGFMAHKANFFGDDETFNEVLLETNPREVKALGRKVQGFNKQAWECVAEGFMSYVNLLKFSQNEAMRAELKGTNSLILVEASPFDTIWGIGISVEDAIAGKPWQGRNLLGEALMRVRGLL
jgi:ribA/ribD-fused uncharacterized protein